MYQRKLMAVVSVAQDKRVRCQHPGCKQTIYRSIHVINDGGTIKVIGSTCIQKGDYGALGEAAFTMTSGGGRLLTDAERDQLANNTEELVRQLESQYQARKIALEQAQATADVAKATEEEARREASLAKLQFIKERLAQSHIPRGPVVNPGSSQRSQTIPWQWVDPMRSMLYLELEDGTQWLRVQARASHGGMHHLVPFPIFNGWDEYLPAKYGSTNATGDGYTLTNLVAAIKFMRGLRPQREVVCASFQIVLQQARQAGR